LVTPVINSVWLVAYMDPAFSNCRYQTRRASLHKQFMRAVRCDFNGASIFRCCVNVANLIASKACDVRDLCSRYVVCSLVLWSAMSDVPARLLPASGFEGK
jgi:hypothetical protein